MVGDRFIQFVGRSVSGLLGRESALIRRARPAYERILDRYSAGRGISWTINGADYRIDPSSRHRLAHLYDPTVADFLRARVQPGAVCLDVGANVGVYVLQFARWVGPTGRIVAFEPNAGARRVLERHLRMNHIADQVQVVPVAVGEADGEATLFAAGADGMSRLGQPNPLIADSVESQAVHVVTLDRFCLDGSIAPDWMLIDIEGFEIAALAGAQNIIRARGQALGIVVEMHPGAWSSAATTRQRAESLLEELQFRPIPLTGQTDPLGEHGTVFLERF